MIRTIIMFIFINGLLAKKYLIEVGNKTEDNGGVEEEGEDYSNAVKIQMTEYG